MSSKQHGRTEQLQMLLDTVEQIRSEKFADVPKELVRRILLHHADAAASETDLMRSLEQLVDEHLNGQG